MDEDYPKTLLELERRFCTEEACVEYLAALRWPGGWVCPRCMGGDAWSVRRHRWLCDHCRYEMSVTAGTIFQDSHVPLTIWFRAMWQITSQKNGISALGLQRVLGLGSYKTAWAMLHKLRRAMIRPGRDRLDGVGKLHLLGQFQFHVLVEDSGPLACRWSQIGIKCIRSMAKWRTKMRRNRLAAGSSPPICCVFHNAVTLSFSC